VLVLEPGDELYPRCLEVLLGTIEAMPDAAFVYAIVQLTGLADGVAPAGGGEQLTSIFGWEPPRLRLGNYISTPYLVRGERLHAVGGFADELRLGGLEDYDLWCRIAERGWRGQLVPQILSCHRTAISPGESSATIPTSNLGFSVLAERAPRLMAGIGASAL
jgi:hypothetical protein